PRCWCGPSCSGCRWSSFLLELVDEPFEVGERLIPEPIELLPQLTQPIRIGSVDPSGPLGAIEDQTGGLPHLQMLRDGWAGYGEHVGEFTNRSWPNGHELEDRAPCWVSESSPGVHAIGKVSLTVSKCLPSAQLFVPGSAPRWHWRPDVLLPVTGGDLAHD